LADYYFLKKYEVGWIQYYIYLLELLICLNLSIASILAFKNKKSMKGILLLLPIVLFIILAYFSDPFYTPREYTIEDSKASMRGVQSSLELYYTHYKYYPKNLEILINEGYLQEDGGKDLWKNNYSYFPIYSGDKKKVVDYMLRSNGPDGKPYTADDIEAPIKVEKKVHK